MEEAPISLIKPSKDDYIYSNNKGEYEEMIYRPEYKPAEELKLNTKVGGLKGVTDFDAFNKINKEKKMQKLEQTRQ